MINSSISHFTATSIFFIEANLLPKLRFYFAEFLRESYLAPLSILNLPTCVGLRYKAFKLYNVTNFSWKYDKFLLNNFFYKQKKPSVHVFAFDRSCLYLGSANIGFRQ